MRINPNEMQLKRSRAWDCFAWLWIAPTGKRIYFIRATNGNKWFWLNSPDDTVSSEPFKSLEDLKMSFAIAYSDEGEYTAEEIANFIARK